MYGDLSVITLWAFRAKYTPPRVARVGSLSGLPVTYPPIPSRTRSMMITPLLHLKRVERVLRTEPDESSPAPGLIVVALRLSPTIVVYSGTIIGSCVSTYVPAFTKITAGFSLVGVPILEQAYFNDAHAVSIDPPPPALSTPFLAT